MRSVTKRPVLRVLAMLMGAWLFLVPQVVCSSAVLALYEEQGTTPPPLIEEEEVAHKDVPPGHTVVLHRSLSDASPRLPHWEELLLHTLHGEVPHPPPWA